MKQHLISAMEVLPGESSQSRLEEQESKAAHLSYQAETRFFTHIKNGEPDKLVKAMGQYLEAGFGVGRMSADSLRQTQYWAVICVALSTRYAIQGGLDELDAYRFSDACVQLIDKTATSEEIFTLMLEKAVALARKVKNARENPRYSLYVKSCIAYINKNLPNRITLGDLARECHVSADYLSLCFRRETGMNPAKYILKKKLDFSKELLEEGMKSGDISCALSFSSQSHFITCFKKEFGVTPKQYATCAGKDTV